MPSQFRFFFLCSYLFLCLSWAGFVHAQQPASEAAQPVQRFDIFEYQVEGNSVLEAEKIERAVYRHMGEGKTIADVEEAKAALEKTYRDAGYGTVVVDIPEQRVNQGVVILKVIQAEVSRLRVVGSRYYSQGRILATVPALAEGQVPHFPAVQQQLAQVNRSNDLRVTPVLRPGKLPGTTEVDLDVEDTLPLHGSVEWNNRYSANTTHPRLVASLRYDNLWQRGHSLGLQYQTSPHKRDEVKVGSLSYSVPNGDGLLVLTATRSDSNVVAGVGDVNVLGRGSIYGLRSIIPLRGPVNMNHTLTLGADYKDFKETVNFGAAAGFKTPVRYLPFSINYSAIHSEKDGSYWQYGAGFTFSLRGLASKQSQFDDKRFQGQDNFSYLKFDLARLETLGNSLSLFAKVDGQVSGQPLISNEQYVAGGVDSVRGYLDASQVGDTALRGTLELRSSNLLDGEGWLQRLTVHGFVDGAALKLRAPLPGQQSSFQMVGVGVGMKLKVQKSFSLALDLALPRRSTTNVPAGDLHLHASGLFEF